MWLNSSGHRKHLVGTEMNHIGVGVANGSRFFGPCTLLRAVLLPLAVTVARDR